MLILDCELLSGSVLTPSHVDSDSDDRCMYNTCSMMVKYFLFFALWTEL